MNRFHKEEGQQTLRLEFFSSMSMVDLAAGALRGFLNRLGLMAQVFELGLLFREAACNAVIHGCGRNRAGPVRLEVEVRDGWVTISVADPGEGWDWRGCDYALPPEDAVGGRGLFIIHSYSDEVIFNDKGNGIVMRKRIAG